MKQLSRRSKQAGRSALLMSALCLTTSTPAHFLPRHPALLGGVAYAQGISAAPATVAQAITHAQMLLDANDRTAIDAFQDAAQRSLVALFAVTGPDIITAPPTEMPPDRFTLNLIRQAEQSHYGWGLAAKHFGGVYARDASITAFCRAARLAGILRPDDPTLVRDALLELSGALQEGLPDYAPDDTMDTIATVAHGNLWQPRRFSFDYSGLAQQPAGPSPTRSATAASMPVEQTTITSKQEFLITSGKVFPPFMPSAIEQGVTLSRIPPLYRKVPPNNLPPVLQLDKMIIGYERETTGPNKGLWHKVVNVFYASPYLTRDKRDDRPRAESLCAQFLKLHTLAKAELGLDNLYMRNQNGGPNNGVTNLWLSEVSAWWPQDDDDPAVQNALGTRMPLPNTPVVLNGKKMIQSDIRNTPLWHPWGVAMTDVDDINTVHIANRPGVFPNPTSTTTTTPGTPPSTTPPPLRNLPDEAQSGAGAGQIDSARGEIMFFKMTEPRHEGEWLRELAHEYGHVILPPFNGFHPPLEPYGNGLVGETLGMLWAASLPNQFASQTVPANATENQNSKAAVTTLDTDLDNHVKENALASLRFWNAHGPGSPLRADGTQDGLEYLQGLTVYLERVYGIRLLSATLKPLVERSAPALDNTRPTLNNAETLNAAALLESSSNAIREAFADGQKTLPIWLPGALELPAGKPSTADFIARAPMTLTTNTRYPCWLEVPPTATTLHIEWKAAAPNNAATLQVEGGWRNQTSTATTRTATSATVIDINGRQGWQRFAFTPSANLTVVSAWFERNDSITARTLRPTAQANGY